MIVTTTHFSTQMCSERSRRAQEQGAAMVMVMPPYHGATLRVAEPQIEEFLHRLSDAIGIPIMIQDAPVSGTPLSASFLARLAREDRTRRLLQDRTAGAAAKLRELIRLGGAPIEGPWDGEEGITLLADLDAGATGSMTGGGYPDGMQAIVDAYAAGRRDDAVSLVRTLAAAHQLREPPVRLARRQSAHERGPGNRLRGAAPSVPGAEPARAKRVDRHGAPR